MNNNMSSNKRRIVIGQYPNGDIKLISDENANDVIVDPARPGYRSTKIWATLSTPANFNEKAEDESNSYQHSLIPPKSGSICRFVQIPPDNSYKKVTNEDVKSFYESMNSENLLNSQNTKHPYMHKKNSLDYVYVMSGSITLILDDEEIDLEAGDTVVNIAANHAWSNNSDSTCELFISSHDALGH